MTKAKIALDVHAHLAPIDLPRLAGIEGVQWSAEHGRLKVDGHAIGIDALYSPQALISWMDEQGVEQAWVSIPPPLYRAHLAEDAARAWCAYLNGALEETCARYGGRLAPLRHLPFEHPALAREIATAPGGRRYAAAAGGYGGTLSDDAYESLWQVLDQQQAFLFLHPGHCCDPRLARFYLENLMGNPLETAVAAAHLAFGGVAARYAGIRFCLAHAGGATAMLAGRYERGYKTKRPGLDMSLPSPGTALRGLFVDCIAHDAQALALSASVFGSTRILFGSDWPFPMGLPKPHEQLADVDPVLLDGIRAGNARPLLEE